MCGPTDTVGSQVCDVVVRTSRHLVHLRAAPPHCIMDSLTIHIAICVTNAPKFKIGCLQEEELIYGI